MAAPSVTYTFADATTIVHSEVNQNFTDIINGITDGTEDLTISALTCNGAVTLNGAVQLGNATADDITITGRIASDLDPKTAASNTIGDATQTWQALYLDSGVSDGGTIYFDASSTKFIRANAAGTDLLIDAFTTLTVDANIVPQTDVTNTLGTSSLNYTGLHLDNGATDGGAVFFNAGTTAFLKSDATGATLQNGGFTAWMVPDGSTAAPGIYSSTGTSDTGISMGVADQVHISTGGVERVEFGTTTIFNETGADVDLRVEGTGNANLLYVDAGNDRVGVGTSSPDELLHVSGTGVVRTHIESTDGNAILDVDSFTNNDSVIQFQEAGTVAFSIGNDASANAFKISANAALETSTLMTVESGGDVGIGTSSPATPFHVYKNQDGGGLGRFEQADDDTNALTVYNSNSTTTDVNGILRVNSDRTSSSSFIFLRTFADVDGTPDSKHRLLGNGTANADGAWTDSGGGDYAEYFEWADGNPDGEDRVGYSVVFAEGTDLIRIAQQGETPIGVISGRPTIIANTAWSHWSGKYMRDEFNRDLMEDYTLVQWGDPDKEERKQYMTDRIPEGVEIPEDAEYITHDSKGTKLQRQVLNPDFDPNHEYTEREHRKEWDAVGILGRLRIRNDQPTSSNWIKFRDISENVSEWLVK
jgi:hypothetical protein